MLQLKLKGRDAKQFRVKSTRSGDLPEYSFHPVFARGRDTKWRSELYGRARINRLLELAASDFAAAERQVDEKVAARTD